jgi:hypothetical protein
MKGERKFIQKILLGCVAGLISVTLTYILNRAGLYIAWAPIIAAALIGAIPGIAEKSSGKVILGVILGCIGWICGEVVSRQLFHSMATWISVGGFVGLTGGILERSPKSMIGGLILGAIGGFIGLVAGFLTMANDFLLNLDMQAVTILCAAIFINTLLGILRPRIAAAENGEHNEPESLNEK